MRKVDQAPDLTGRELLRGDTVTTVGGGAWGGTTGKIKDIANDDGILFVEVRPIYQSTGKGVWHASDRLLWLSRPTPPKPKAESKPDRAPSRPPPGTLKTNAKRVKLKK